MRKKVLFVSCLILCILGMVFIGKLSTLDPNNQNSNSIDSGQGSTTSIYQQTIPELSQAEWFQGETIKTEYHYPYAYILGETLQLAIYESSYSWTTDLRYPFQAEGFTQQASGSATSTVYLRNSFEIQAIVPGTMHITMEAYKTGSGGYTSWSVTKDWSCSQDYIDSNGRVGFYYECEFNGVGTSQQELYVRDPSNPGTLYNVKNAANSDSITNLEYVWVDIEIYHEPDPETFYPRLQQRTVNSDTTEYKLELNNPAYGTEFRIYTEKPLSYVIEDCEITENPGYYSLTETIGYITYHIYFSESKQQYLSVSESSREDFESHSLSNGTIVLSGAYAGKITKDSELVYDFTKENLYMKTNVFVEERPINNYSELGFYCKLDETEGTEIIDSSSNLASIAEYSLTEFN
ncbi:MAG: hypothetical protein ACFE9L_03350 [Candidatus Hodarchaeota archaeon]